MDISVSKAGNWTVVSASGDVDLHHSMGLRVEVVRHLDEGADVLLDMSGVGYLDSSGIAALAQSLSHAKKLDRRFGLVQPTEAVMRILHLTRLDSVFIIYDSVQAAPDA